MTLRFECPETDCTFTVHATDRRQVLAMARKHTRDRHAEPLDDGTVERQVAVGE
jgi:predicted small metal-binding protein